MGRCRVVVVDGRLTTISRASMLEKVGRRIHYIGRVAGTDAN